MTKIEKDLRFLKIYSGILTLICLALAIFIFKMSWTKKFDEIDVERINIVEKDGKLRMVLSNQVRQHPGTLDGVTYHERNGQRPPGLMFFTEKGDEVGGLVFDGNTGKHHGGSLTFDKFRGDQTIQFTHDEDPDGKYFAGVKMNDQNMPLTDLINKDKEISKLPTKEDQDLAWKKLKDDGLLMAERLRIGRDYDKSSIIRLKDAKGKIRIEMKVEANGNSKLNFLDELGKVVYSLPPTSSHKKIQ
ncbi:hypothetical protein K2X05_09895 [bacterium]|nr:hypothetical protein [bacterium]